jgi:transcription antitermination factor NusG
MSEIKEKAWFALYTKPRNEFKAAVQIGKCGIHYFLPAIIRIKQWSDRKKKINEPLLRGYIFIYADEKERILSLEQQSVVRCIFDSGRPAKIPEWQINNLKIMLNSNSELFIKEGIIPGTQVRIKNGPFKGVIGTVQNAEGGKTIAISIDLLNRSIIARVSLEDTFEVVKKSK